MDLAGSVRKLALGALAVSSFLASGSAPAHAQAAATQKPNILFIMGDDIGWMQPSIYHRGLMVGRTPNIDRIGNEGAIFMTYYAEQSCTAGRNSFFTGMHPLRTGMIPPQLPGSPSYLRPGTPALAWFLRDLGYTTGEFGKNHLGDHTAALPTAHGFQEFWGYLYHLDAMQGVSFPDINKTPPRRGSRRSGPQNNHLPDAAATCPLVSLLRWNGGQPDVPGRGPADPRTLEDGGRGDFV
jgi:arylsulfatase A-like enzyme